MCVTCCVCVYALCSRDIEAECGVVGDAIRFENVVVVYFE